MTVPAERRKESTAFSSRRDLMMRPSSNGMRSKPAPMHCGSCNGATWGESSKRGRGAGGVCVGAVGRGGVCGALVAWWSVLSAEVCMVVWVGWLEMERGRVEEVGGGGEVGEEGGV